MKSFEILAEQYRPMLMAYLKTLAGDHDLAEDLAQETLMAAQRSLSRFRRGENFGAWLRGIARNKTLESKRAAARRPIVADSRIIEGMEDVYVIMDGPHSEHETWRDRRALLRVCVERLSEKLRSAVDEVYHRERSLKEAAQRLGISFQSIAQRLHRARALLAECVAARLAGEERP